MFLYILLAINLLSFCAPKSKKFGLGPTLVWHLLPSELSLTVCLAQYFVFDGNYKSTCQVEKQQQNRRSTNLKRRGLKTAHHGWWDED